MKADSIFAIGSTHEICEDYAWSGSIPIMGTDQKRAVAVVADGCSTARHTDFGSRLLVKSAVNRISVWGSEYSPSQTIQEASHMARSLQLEERCLDSTLLTLVEREGGIVEARLSGDGFLVLRDRGTQEWIVHRSEYSNNAPAYLSYTLHPNYLEKFFNPPKELDLPEPNGIRRTITNYGDWTNELSTYVDRNDFQSFTIAFDIPKEDFDIALIFTDGLDSFVQTDMGRSTAVSFAEVLKAGCNMESTGGRFIERHLQSFLRRHCVKHNWKHKDDFSCAGIYLGDL